MSEVSEPLSPARSAGALGVGELRPLVSPELSPGDAEVGTGCKGTRANESEQKEDNTCLTTSGSFIPLKLLVILAMHGLQLTHLEVWIGGNGVVRRCCLLGMGWMQEVGQQYSGSASVNVQETVQYETKSPKGQQRQLRAEPARALLHSCCYRRGAGAYSGISLFFFFFVRKMHSRSNLRHFFFLISHHVEMAISQLVYIISFMVLTLFPPFLLLQEQLFPISPASFPLSRRERRFCTLW